MTHCTQCGCPASVDGQHLTLEQEDAARECIAVIREGWRLRRMRNLIVLTQGPDAMPASMTGANIECTSTTTPIGGDAE